MLVGLAKACGVTQGTLGEGAHGLMLPPGIPPGALHLLCLELKPYTPCINVNIFHTSRGPWPMHSTHPGCGLPFLTRRRARTQCSATWQSAKLWV